MWHFSSTNSPGCKPAKTLLLHPLLLGRRASHETLFSDTQAPRNVLQANLGQNLGLGTFVWDFGTSSLKTRLLFSLNFYSRAAGLDCYQEKKAQKKNPTQTQVYDYSSMAWGAILPRKKQHTDANTDNTALRLRWTQMCIWQKYRNIQCHSLVVQK